MDALILVVDIVVVSAFVAGYVPNVVVVSGIVAIVVCG